MFNEDKGSIEKNDIHIQPFKTFREYYSSGKIKAICNYNKNKQKHGYFGNFYENGVLKSSYYYKYGKINGYVVHFYPNSVLKSYCMYSYNRKIGFFKSYHENGCLKTFWKYDKYGKKTGTELEFYNDGNLKSKTQLKNDERNGKRMEYFPNGNVYLISFYKNNERNGKYLEFDENNNLIHSSFYLNGKLNGMYFKFKNNKVISQGFYTYGRKHNKEIQYDENEIIKSIFHYKFGYKDGLQYENIITSLISYYKYNRKLLIRGDISKECCVCYESSFWKTECNHFICVGCSDKLQTLSCPMCRQDF